jgi:hypothetical protein
MDGEASADAGGTAEGTSETEREGWVERVYPEKERR